MSVKVGDVVTVKDRAGTGEVLFIRNSGEANVQMDTGISEWVRKGDYQASKPTPRTAPSAPKFED